LALPAPAVHAGYIETTFKGAIYSISDPENILGYGSPDSAIGKRVTFTFLWDPAAAPGDFYGGARFPVEADYTAFGLPAWVTAEVIFDSGVTFRSVDFDGTGGIQQQVKIQDNCARCSFDVIGGEAWDSYGNFTQTAAQWDNGHIVDTLSAGARIFDYTQLLLSDLSIDQLVAWLPGNPGTYYADGSFRYRHLDTTQNPRIDLNVFANVYIDSLTSRSIGVPEPSTLALLAVALAAAAWTRRCRLYEPSMKSLLRVQRNCVSKIRTDAAARAR